MLSLRIVDRHYREFQLALRGHRAQPDYTRRRLFGAADHIGEQFAAAGVQHGNQVHAVVHGNVRAHIEYTVHMRVVLFVAFTLNRIDRHFVVRNQSGRNVILRAQRVAGTQGSFGAASDQNAHQVSGFGGDVHGGRNADAFKRLLTAETLFEQIKHRHFFGGPLHTKATFFGQLNIGNVVGQFFGSHSFSPEQIKKDLRFWIYDLRNCLLSRDRR